MVETGFGWPSGVEGIFTFVVWADFLVIFISLLLSAVGWSREEANKKSRPSKLWPRILRVALIVLIVVILLSFFDPGLWLLVFIGAPMWFMCFIASLFHPYWCAGGL